MTNIVEVSGTDLFAGMYDYFLEFLVPVLAILAIYWAIRLIIKCWRNILAM